MEPDLKNMHVGTCRPIELKCSQCPFLHTA
jgi:hypothetical protein